MERSTIFHGKTHYKWPFSIAMLNYQRVFFFLSVMHDIIMSKALGTSVPQCATAFQLTWMADRGTSPRLGKTGGIPGSMAGL